MLLDEGAPGQDPRLFGFFPFAVTPRVSASTGSGGRPSLVNKSLLPDLAHQTPIHVPIHRSESEEVFHPHSPVHLQPVVSLML